VLACDHVDDRYRSIAGDYTDMIERMLVTPLPDVEAVTYDVWGGTIPAATDECDAWVCSGSRASVYDDLAWIAPLSRFVARVRDAGAPFVGICFGHQLLAHALGGRAERAAGGWGVGAHRVEVHVPEAWMDPPLVSPTLLFMHQDQVTLLPPGAEPLARTDHCDVAMFRVGGSMLGIQAHPEFDAAYVAALLEAREARIGSDRTAAALRSLGSPTDEHVVASWLAQFLRRVGAGG
jgi:GMP synthase-like glutamine amidotransferase